MFNLFKNRRDRRIAAKLLEHLYLNLKSYLPDIYENSEHWKLHTISIKDNTIDVSNISYDNPYVEINRKRHTKHYNIKDIQIFSDRLQVNIPFNLRVEFNLIKKILFNDHKFDNSIDLDKIDTSKMIVEEIIYENHDKKLLLSILGETILEKSDLLDIDDTFEIELGNRKFYTIVDMEDGNYVAVNKKGQVFRLLHDSEQQAKKIYNSVDEFLIKFDGEKNNLQYLFDD